MLQPNAELGCHSASQYFAIALLVQSVYSWRINCHSLSIVTLPSLLLGSLIDSLLSANYRTTVYSIVSFQSQPAT